MRAALIFFNLIGFTCVSFLNKKKGTQALGRDVSPLGFGKNFVERWTCKITHALRLFVTRYSDVQPQPTTLCAWFDESKKRQSTDVRNNHARNDNAE